MVASSIWGRQPLRSQFNLVGVGGVNSGIPFVFPFSSYLEIKKEVSLILYFPFYLLQWCVNLFLESAIRVVIIQYLSMKVAQQKQIQTIAKFLVSKKITHWNVSNKWLGNSNKCNIIDTEHKNNQNKQTNKLKKNKHIIYPSASSPNVHSHKCPRTGASALEIVLQIDDNQMCV